MEYIDLFWEGAINDNRFISEFSAASPERRSEHDAGYSLADDADGSRSLDNHVNHHGLKGDVDITVDIHACPGRVFQIVAALTNLL